MTTNLKLWTSVFTLCAIAIYGDASGTVESAQRHRRDVKDATLCSKFSGEYTPVYYCWLADPCIEDLVEAPRFYYSQDCSLDDCEALPSTLDSCKDWILDDGVQSCSEYGPLSCCKHKTCADGLECIDLVPGAAICRAPPVPVVPATVVPSVTGDEPPAGSSPGDADPSPSLRLMPPHAPPPPPPPIPVSPSPPIPMAPSPRLSTSPSPSAPLQSVDVPSLPVQLPPPSLPSVGVAFNPEIPVRETPPAAPAPSPAQRPPLSSDVGNSEVPNPIPDSVSPQIVIPATTTPAASAPATAQSTTEQPTWTTALIIVLASGVVLFAAVWIFERGSRDEQDGERRDDEMAIDEAYWNALAEKQGYGGLNFPNPGPPKKQPDWWSESMDRASRKDNLLA